MFTKTHEKTILIDNVRKSIVATMVVFVLAVIASFVAPALPVNAVTCIQRSDNGPQECTASAYEQLSLNEQAVAWTQLNTIGSSSKFCDIPTKNPKQSSSLNLFAPSSNIQVVGFHVDATDGKYECTNVSHALVLKLAGYSSAEALIADYIKTSGAKTDISKTAGQDRIITSRDDLKLFVGKKMFGGDPTLSPAVRYAILVRAFTEPSTCNAKVTDAAKGPYFTPTVDGTVTPTNYAYDEGGDNTAVGPGMSAGDDFRFECKTIAEKLKDKAFITQVAQNVKLLASATGSNVLDQVNTYNGSDKGDETCAIKEGIGWLICPVVGFMARITDAAYALIETLLVFQLENPFDTNSQMYKIWSNVRNLANVMFVFVFLVIVLSQSTGFGISNYGIKKLLPRIIVGAILVNLSYYICIFALDVSNILGAGLDAIVMSPVKGSVTENVPTLERVATNILAGEVVIAAGGAATAVVGTSVMSYALLSLISIIIPVVLIATTTVIVAIIGYKVLWVLLIVMSPLIAVASILPGTQGFYDKGMDLAKGLIIFYPLVAVAFAISSLTGIILRSAAQGH